MQISSVSVRQRGDQGMARRRATPRRRKSRRRMAEQVEIRRSFLSTFPNGDDGRVAGAQSPSVGVAPPSDGGRRCLFSDDGRRDPASRVCPESLDLRNCNYRVFSRCDGPLAPPRGPRPPRCSSHDLKTRSPSSLSPSFLSLLSARSCTRSSLLSPTLAPLPPCPLRPSPSPSLTRCVDFPSPTTCYSQPG